MRLLLDQGLPRSAIHHLDAARVESAHVGESGLATASDEKIPNSRKTFIGCRRWGVSAWSWRNGRKHALHSRRYRSFQRPRKMCGSV
jgi:hypothetical protein